MKHTIILLAFCFVALFSSAQVITNDSLDHKINLALDKRLEKPSEKLRDSGISGIIGGSLLTLGLGALFLHLERKDNESKYAMYGFFGVGTVFTITSAGLKISAARSMKYNTTSRK